MSCWLHVARSRAAKRLWMRTGLVRNDEDLRGRAAATEASVALPSPHPCPPPSLHLPRLSPRPLRFSSIRSRPALRQRGRRHCAKRLRLAATSKSGTCIFGAARYIQRWMAERSSDYATHGTERTRHRSGRAACSGCKYDLVVPLPLAPFPLSPAPTSPVPA